MTKDYVVMATILQSYSVTAANPKEAKDIVLKILITNGLKPNSPVSFQVIEQIIEETKEEPKKEEGKEE